MAARIFVRTRNLPFLIREPIERKKNIPAHHIRLMIIAVFRPYHGQLQTRFWRCDEMGHELFLEVQFTNSE
jgi:hypothetical protein